MDETGSFHHHHIKTNFDNVEGRDALVQDLLKGTQTDEQIVATMLKEKERRGYNWDITVADVRALRSRV